MKKTFQLANLILLVGMLALQGVASQTPPKLAGRIYDGYVLDQLLRGVSDAIAELDGISFTFDVSGYQMADRAFVCTTSGDVENLSTFLEPHMQQVFDRVGDLAMPFLRGLPIYLGVADSVTWSFDPKLWAVLTYDDPSNIVLEYVAARPEVLEKAQEFSQALERGLGEGVILAIDGCHAVPGLGAYIELMIHPVDLDLPYRLDSYGEWQARLFDLIESDGAALFTAMAADEFLCVVTPNGFYRTPVTDRLVFMIPSATYLDTSTWQSWTQDW